MKEKERESEMYVNPRARIKFGFSAFDEITSGDKIRPSFTFIRIQVFRIQGLPRRRRERDSGKRKTLGLYSKLMSDRESANT